MSRYLTHLARRVADAPDFLACALAEYARSERLEDEGLAARLGCPVATPTHLRLCRMPRAQAPFFWQDVERIAQRFSLSPYVLGEAARRGEALVCLRTSSAEQHQAAGFLLAARDEAPESNAPEEPPS